MPSLPSGTPLWSTTTSIFRFFGLCMPTRFFAFPKPCGCARFAGCSSEQWAKRLHSAEEHCVPEHIVKRDYAHHDRSQAKNTRQRSLQLRVKPSFPARKQDLDNGRFKCTINPSIKFSAP